MVWHLNLLLDLNFLGQDKQLTNSFVIFLAELLISFKELLEQIFKIVSKKNLSGFIIQPTTSISEPTLEQLLVFYDNVYPYYDQVRVVPQLHKIISAP